MILNIFQNDVFSLASMSAAIDQVEYVPQTLIGSGVFNAEPIRTELVGIESREGKISIVDFSERGSERESRDKTQLAKMAYVKTPRLSLTSKIFASELNFLREFGTEDQIKQAQQEITRRQFGPNGLVPDIDFTLERMAMGCINGKILNKAGDIIYDYFDLLGRTESAGITLNLTTLDDGQLRKEITQKVLRPMRKKAYGARFQFLRCYCGKDAFDKLNANPEYYKTFVAQQAGAELRESYFEKPIIFAGVEWVEYVGDNDDVITVADNEMKFVPWGANDIYSRVMSPGESMTQIGTLGQALYSNVMVDDKRDEFVEVDVSTYSLLVNKRPDMPITCTVS
jgi:hypothetical protein